MWHVYTTFNCQRHDDIYCTQNLTHWGWDKMAVISQMTFFDISSNENFQILKKVSLKYVPWGLIDNMEALVQIMACCWAGTKPLSEPMMA